MKRSLTAREFDDFLEEIASGQPPPRPEHRLGRLAELQAFLADAHRNREKLLALSDADLSAYRVTKTDKHRLLASVEQEIRRIYGSIFDLEIERRAAPRPAASAAK